MLEVLEALDDRLDLGSPGIRRFHLAVGGKTSCQVVERLRSLGQAPQHLGGQFVEEVRVARCGREHGVPVVPLFPQETFCRQ
jgi:hypothetical protein